MGDTEKGSTKEIALLATPREKAKTRSGGKKKDESCDRNTKESARASSKDPKVDKQVRIDDMLRGETECEPSMGRIVEMMESFTQKLNTLASKEYINKSLENLTTEEFISDKLSAFKSELAADIKKDFDKVYEQLRNIKSRMLEAVNNIEDLKSETEGMKLEIENLKKDLQQTKESNKKLKGLVAEKEQAFQWNEHRLNEQEQYSRINNVRIFGVDDKKRNETAEETTSLICAMFHEKLDLQIGDKDICVAHRIGRFSTDGNRAIICKFVRRSTKKMVIRARRQLKGTPIVIREDLTVKNVKLVQLLSTREDVKSVWTDDGVILVLLRNGIKVKVDINTDLSKPLSRV